MTPTEPKLLSLFSGIGGLDIGAKAAGLNTSLAVDNDADALQLLQTIVPCDALATDLGTADPQTIAKKLGVGPRDTLVIIGGPPCTGFSHAGFWLESKRNGSDPATSHLSHFVTFVRALNPKVWLLENVPGLTFKNYRSILEEFTNEMSSLGYTLFSRILNAAGFGVPQHRRRFFVVGIAGDDVDFTFPEPAFTADNYRTAGWAFEELTARVNQPEPDEVLSGKYAALLPDVPAGDNYLFFTEERGHPSPQFKWRSKYWSFLKKLDAGEPSNTVPATRVTNNGPFHWSNRHLRIAEIKRLQGLPDPLPLEPKSLHRRYAGNAVPPLLGAAVVGSIMQQVAELEPFFDIEVSRRLVSSDATAAEISKLLS